MGFQTVKRIFARGLGLRPALPSLYIASKVHRAPAWRALRGAYPIVARWIDKPDGLDAAAYRQLWIECIEDAAHRADMVVIYAGEGDTLKGCLIEAGACLGQGKPVYQIGDCHSLRAGDGSDASFVSHPRWHRVPSIAAAVAHWQQTYAAPASAVVEHWQ